MSDTGRNTIEQSGLQLNMYSPVIKRLFVILALILSAQYLSHGLINTRPMPPLAHLALQTTVGAWQGTPVKVDSSVYEVLAPDAAVQMHYALKGAESGGAQPAVEVIAIYNRDPRAFHTPDICLTSAGWAVVKRERCTVAQGERAIPLDVLTGTRKNQVTNIAYYFADAQQRVTGWLPSMVQSAGARALHRQAGAVQVQYGYDPRLRRSDGTFTPEFQQLICSIAADISGQLERYAAQHEGTR